ncbi:MAG: rod shape-determining protein MreD [Desulfuromonas sp.]|nr:rod shape-determining protein MreD [Desulfuromonas sp.]
MRVLLYLGLAWLALLLQTVLLPPLFPGGVKPDLILLLAIWIGLREPPLKGGALVYGLGWLYDAYAGVYPGLHGFVLLAIFLTVCGMATRLNTESLPLLWCLVGGGTLMHAALTAFALEFFVDVDRFWALIIASLPAQLLYNLLAGYLARNLYFRLKKMVPDTPPGVLARFGRRHAP